MSGTLNRMIEAKRIAHRQWSALVDGEQVGCAINRDRALKMARTAAEAMPALLSPDEEVLFNAGELAS